MESIADLIILFKGALGPMDGTQQASGDTVIDIPDEKAPIVSLFYYLIIYVSK